VTGGLVRKLIVVGNNCVGVEYSRGTKTHRAEAKREVVLSAGAIGSAQLLLLSGIGPADDLRRLAIDVVVDLPGVGKNLQDHMIAGVTYSSTKPVPAGVNNHSEIVAALRTSNELPAPDVQLLGLDIPLQSPTVRGPENGYTITFTVLRPQSRGSIQLATADPETAPLIDPNYLGDERDMVGMLAGLRLTREVGQTKALAGWRDKEVLPGPDVRDESQERDYIRRIAGTYFHVAGTCRTGTDATAVVDPHLRVRGVGGLRVADASVMPTMVSANPNATVLAIAERAAWLISGRPFIG
jgi:choline dehydrogenase